MGCLLTPCPSPPPSSTFSCRPLYGSDLGSCIRQTLALEYGTFQSNPRSSSPPGMGAFQRQRKNFPRRKSLQRLLASGPSFSPPLSHPISYPITGRSEEEGIQQL